MSPDSTDLLMDAYAWASIMAMVIVLIGGTIAAVLAHLDTKKYKRNIQKLEAELAQEREQLFHKHGY